MCADVDIFAYIFTFLIFFITPLILIGKGLEYVSKKCTLFKERNCIVLDVKKEYYSRLTGRTVKDSEYCGAHFREHILIPKFKTLKPKQKLIIDFTDCSMIGPSWLEEVFGGLRRLGYTPEFFDCKLIIKSNRYAIVSRAEDYAKGYK